MRLFFYYITHSFLNTIKKLLKTWVAIFVVLMICGGIMGSIFKDKAKTRTSETSVETTADDPSGETDEDKDSEADDEITLEFSFGDRIKNFMKTNNLTSANIVDIAISALFLLILATNVANSKSSGKLFQPADVTMLFASPLKPQSVLMFRLTCTLGMSFFLSLFMLYQIPNLMNGAGLGLWGALSCVVVYTLIDHVQAR